MCYLLLQAALEKIVKKRFFIGSYNPTGSISSKGNIAVLLSCITSPAASIGTIVLIGRIKAILLPEDKSSPSI